MCTLRIGGATARVSHATLTSTLCGTPPEMTNHLTLFQELSLSDIRTRTRDLLGLRPYFHLVAYDSDTLHLAEIAGDDS